MILITILVLANLMFGAIMFLLVCVNPNDQGLLGMLHRFFFKTVTPKLM